MLKVREVDGLECDQTIVDMHCRLFGGGAKAVPLRSEGLWWIAYHDGEAVGFAQLVHANHYQKTGYLARSGVDVHCQGFGVQKRLIRARLAKARALGWHFAMSDVHTRNPASANSLIRCGFKLFVPWKKWSGRDFIYFQRRL